MKAEYLNPFLVAVLEVMGKFFPDLDIDRGDPDAVEAPLPLRGAATYVGISGDLEGQVIYDMEPDTAVGLANARNGQTFEELDGDVRGFLQELGEVMTDEARSKLSEQGGRFEINVAPPSTIVGSGTEVSDRQVSRYLQIPLETDCGSFVVNLALTEK